MDLQSYKHDCFSKISRTLFDFLNNTYWVSLFYRNNLLIFQTEVSCFSVTLFYSTLFCCGGKANLVRFTLFYSTLLTGSGGKSSNLSGGCTIVITTGENKVLVVCLAGARSLLRPEKINPSHLSGGCVNIITTGKKKF